MVFVAGYKRCGVFVVAVTQWQFSTAGISLAPFDIGEVQDTGKLWPRWAELSPRHMFPLTREERAVRCLMKSSPSSQLLAPNAHL